jgi:tetraacyldisaccharide 4'-kinase
MNRLLYPFSILYEVCSNAHRVLTKSKKLSKPVISVGNLTWGGSGKTPMVIEIAKLLISNGKKTAILSRGYARKESKPILLQNGGMQFSVSDSGDEPMFISKKVPKAAVIAGKKRYENALLFEKEICPDIYILDDGFQHWKIQRDLDIVCINAANPFGNEMIIPAGILREKVSALKRAGLIIITNCDMISPQELKNLENRIFNQTGLKAINVHYGNYEIKKLDLSDSFDINLVKENKVFILSGIGFFEGFRNSVQKAGFKIRGIIELKDHYRYDQKKLDEIFDKTKNSYIIVTEKDAVKLNEIVKGGMREKIAVLSTGIIFKNGEEIWKKEILKTAGN